MKTIIALDIDGTLTPPSRPITIEMSECLMNLNTPFAIIGGSDLSLLLNQFFNPLYKNGFRKQFKAFINNGVIEYDCNFKNDLIINKLSGFNLRDCLREFNYNHLITTLRNMIKKIKLPEYIKIYDNQIIDRESMINLCPIGRPKYKDHEYNFNRDCFISFDKETEYRKKLIANLNSELFGIIKQTKLKITLGGETSLDIGIEGKDKSYAIRKLIDEYDRVIFIGDALFEGGNDYVIKKYADKHPEVRVIETTSWIKTMEILKILGN